jgi:hypothetical protein
MRFRETFTGLLVMVIAATLVACGSSSTSSSSDESGVIAAMIRRAYTSTDPASCTQLATVRSDEQLTGFKGNKAVAVCEKAASDSVNDASSVDVSNVQVHGDRASADVLLHGTNLDGSTITQELVKEDGHWKLDLITAIPHFDGPRYRHAFVALGLKSGGITQAQARCLRGGLSTATDSQLITLNTDPTGGNALFTKLFGRCYF